MIKDMEYGIDFADLLAKYVNFVGDIEGTTFIGRIQHDGTAAYSDVVFTHDELDHLRKLNAS